MQQRLSRLALVTAIGMYLVLLAGALVTKTESGRGCGDDWPLCNGKFVPAYTIESMVEYSHRFVTGIEGILVLATAIAVWRWRKEDKFAKAYAGGALFFTVLQALLGAAAVMWPQSDAALALHFGFSLLAVTCCVLLVFALSPAANREHASGAVSATPGFRYLVWGTTIYSYVVIYLGAYVRHTASQGGCLDWPLCNGQVIPELEGATRIAFTHRLAALILFILILVIFWQSRQAYLKGTIIQRIAAWVCGLTTAQVLSGGLVVLTIGSDWHLLSSLMHTTFITGDFALMFYLSICVRSNRPAYQTIGGAL
jgi:heme a synthase